jgi:hypothetical protein
MGDRFLKSKGLKYIKQCPQEEKERLEGLVYNVFSHMPTSVPNNFNTDDFLITMLNNPQITAQMQADILSTYQDKIARYAARHGKEPSREHRRQFIVSSWTQHAINLNYY